MARFVTGILLIILCASTALAGSGEPWNKYALRVFGGMVENAGSLDSRDGYRELNFKQEPEWGMGFTMALDRMYELELALSRWSTEGKQYSESNPDDYINADLTTTKLALTARRKHFFPNLFVPWWGGGLDIGLLDTSDNEVVLLDGGTYRKSTSSKNYTALGIHIGGGVDVYPSWFSGIALFAEGRYTYYHVSSGFNGDINGGSIYIGLRWDFSQRGYYNKPWDVKHDIPRY